MARYPKLYLIFGSDPVRVHNERVRIVSEVLPREHRAENLTEIEPAANRQLRLRQIAADLVAELATPSFFPEVPRVIVVEQLGDLFSSDDAGEAKQSAGRGRRSKKGAGGGETDVVEYFCKFLERNLTQMSNILILVALEEPEKWRKVQTNSRLYKTVQSLGRIQSFKQPATIFRLTDAFSSRDLRTALQVLPDILDLDDGAGSVMRMLTRQVRFLIQAKLLGRAANAGDEAKALAEKYFPPERGLNLLLEHEFVRGKILQAASRWTITELNALLPKLERLGKAVYPTAADTYVPDLDTELQLFLVEACRSDATAGTMSG